MRPKLLLILILLAALTSNVKPCNICGGGTGDIVVLALDGRALVNLGLTYDSYLGAWDQKGVWRESAFRKDQAKFSLGFAYRLSRHLQFGVSVPYVVNFYNVPGISERSASIGDIFISGRYEFFHEFQMKKKNNKAVMDKVLPYLALTFGISLPTGKSDENSKSEVDVTGKGYYMSSLGVSVTKSLIRNRLQLSTDFSWQHCFMKTYENYFGQSTVPFTKNPGDKFNYSFTFNYIFSNWHAVSLTASGFSQTSYYINNTIGENSNERNLNFILAYTYYPIVPLRITPSIKWTIPSDNFGKNATASTTFNLNVTYYFADYNIK